jgi:hypothetical protein
MPMLSRAWARKSVEYALRNYRYLVADPRFFVMKYAARFEAVRSFASGWDPVEDARRLCGVESAVFRVWCDLPQVLATLRAEGYFVGLQLRPEVVDGLLRRARESVAYAGRDPDKPMLAAPSSRLTEQGPQVASYLDQQDDWPEFQVVRYDRALQEIARAYLGCDPVYLRSELAWSYPNPAASRRERMANAQVFHCDINDYRTLKFFFYLTPVDLSGGPHAYIKKSPIERSLRHQLLGHRCASIPEQQLMTHYAANEVVTICGPAGTGFVGDPYYFHRGTSPTTDARLMMQIEFGMRRYRTWYSG